jgi:acetyl esterase/lipase
MLQTVGVSVAALLAAVGLAGCSAYYVALNRSLVSEDDFILSEDLRYGEDGRQQLDVYRPRESAGRVKTVVFFYGGSWRSGRRDYYRFIGEALTNRGFVVVIPDYRIYPQVRFPAFVEDGARAVRWVRDHIDGYGGDPDQLYLMGHSAGAHIAALLTTDSQYLRQADVPADAVRGLIGLAGPYAFDPFVYRSTRPIFAGLTDPAAIQPATFLTGSEPPMLLLHGDRDEIVYPSNSHALADAVRRTGGRATVVEITNLGHIGLILAFAEPLRRANGIRDQVARFVDHH